MLIDTAGRAYSLFIPYSCLWLWLFVVIDAAVCDYGYLLLSTQLSVTLTISRYRRSCLWLWLLDIIDAAIYDLTIRCYRLSCLRLSDYLLLANTTVWDFFTNRSSCLDFGHCWLIDTPIWSMQQSDRYSRPILYCLLLAYTPVCGFGRSLLLNTILWDLVGHVLHKHSRKMQKLLLLYHRLRY